MSKLSGMTGFARLTGEEDWGAWAWEAKSVNGRGLDVRVNTPPGFDSLERHVKAAASKMFNRGSLQVSLRIEMGGATENVAINEAFLDKLIAATRQAHQGELSSEAIATLMTVKGVVEAGGDNIRDLAMQEGVSAMLAGAAEQVLAELAEARLAEGASLQSIMGKLVDELEDTAKQAASLAGDQPSLLKARLSKQLEELGAGSQVDAERLAAELAITAAKADVREELDRLSAHFETARGLLASGSPAGRKLDFLAQELNREANTLCSKSVSLDLTNAGLGLKGIIDQFKEQAANVE
ncbi:MAG: YicC family protein [Alphaproteobacteria bacterium]|nr:YicC family protein [Alphaproteobacteria bacterium]|tara:strand:- start:521 stop:1408 length:888 start_codon:yes stop_codon:yes gene_type:complete